MTTTDDAIAAGLKAYAAFYETISPESLARLEKFVTADVQFRDPFNDLRGIELMRRAFEAMFDDAEDIRFVIDGCVRQGNDAFLKWRFHFRPRKLGGGVPWEVVGVSELRFTPEGKVAVHIDHWDAGSQFYARLPVIGAVIRWLRGRLSIA